MANLAPVIRQRFFDDNGDPLSGGFLYTYAAGTTTPKATYTDSTGSTPNANPVVLDADGYADVWLGSGAYKFKLEDSNNVELWTKDNITNGTVENGFTTGDVKLTLKTSADDGWVLMDDKTIGSASSGATGRANADTESLYTLIWNNVLDAWAPVTSGRGASAAADFAANKPLKLPRTLGRALAISGVGASLTSRVLGSYLGAETHTLTESEMPSHTHTNTPHDHAQKPGTTTNSVQAGGDYTVFTQTGSTQPTGTNTVYIANTGGGSSHNNMQPSVFLNCMIKL